ncbi:MAG: BON domain-containing protein [Pirellulaceae bacterium]|jgi:osmotically-inducible protein OsmY|nr:BON domain-containing protein [Pirellulaceae bacterium]MDP7020140.1 BON domain-containing protein [Pirellulaceae bacterium]
MTHPTTEVESKARTALASSPIFALRDLTVEVEGDSLLISGHVDSFYHKQLAQEAVRDVAADVQLVNTVAVD